MIIVYNSKTGITEKYAKLLSSMTNITAYSMEEAIKNHQKEDIFFMGWIKINKIRGLKKVLFKFNLIGIAGVGMTAYKEEYAQYVMQQNKIMDCFFYLQGGVNWDRLKGLDKKILNLVRKKTLKSANAYDELLEEDKKMIDIFQNGGDFVSEENLQEIKDFLMEC